MPLAGLTARTMARFAGRYLTDVVTIERLSGRSDGAPTWERLAICNGRVQESSGFTRGADGAAQTYDASVIVKSGQSLSERNQRYRLTVVLGLGPLETNQGSDEDADQSAGPIEKRRRVLEVVSAQPHRDEAGNDFLQVVRCINARVDQGS